MKILVASPETDFDASVWSDLSQSGGHEVDLVGNGSEAVTRLIEAPARYDCLFVSMMMDGLDGFHTARMVRNLNAVIPIVMLCSHNEIEWEVMAIGAGIKAIMHGPISVADIECVLATLGDSGY